MYDYLAKVILIGPSGTGKYVTHDCNHYTECMLTIAGHVYSIASSRMNVRPPRFANRTTSANG